MPVRVRVHLCSMVMKGMKLRRLKSIFHKLLLKRRSDKACERVGVALNSEMLKSIADAPRYSLFRVCKRAVKVKKNIFSQ